MPNVSTMAPSNSDSWLEVEVNIHGTASHKVVLYSCRVIETNIYIYMEVVLFPSVYSSLSVAAVVFILFIVN